MSFQYSSKSNDNCYAKVNPHFSSSRDQDFGRSKNSRGFSSQNKPNQGSESNFSQRESFQNGMYSCNSRSRETSLDTSKWQNIPGENKENQDSLYKKKDNQNSYPNNDQTRKFNLKQTDQDFRERSMDRVQNGNFQNCFPKMNVNKTNFANGFVENFANNQRNQHNRPSNSFELEDPQETDPNSFHRQQNNNNYRPNNGQNSSIRSGPDFSNHFNQPQVNLQKNQVKSSGFLYSSLNSKPQPAQNSTQKQRAFAPNINQPQPSQTDFFNRQYHGPSNSQHDIIMERNKSNYNNRNLGDKKSSNRSLPLEMTPPAKPAAFFQKNNNDPRQNNINRNNGNIKPFLSFQPRQPSNLVSGVQNQQTKSFEELLIDCSNTLGPQILEGCRILGELTKSLQFNTSDNMMNLSGLGAMDIGSENSNSMMINGLFESLAILRVLSDPNTLSMNFVQNMPNVGLNSQTVPQLQTSFTNAPENSCYGVMDSQSLQNRQESFFENKNNSIRSDNFACNKDLASQKPENIQRKNDILSESSSKIENPGSSIVISDKVHSSKEEISMNRNLKEEKPEPKPEPPKKILSFCVDTDPLNANYHAVEIKEKVYKLIGETRYLKTQEKNLIEKLDRFFGTNKEEEKARDSDKKVKEKNEEKEDQSDEFNFDSRYFIYNPTQVCNRCKKPGHYEKWCSEEAQVKCGFCLGNHRMNECQQIVCFNCFKLGHRSRECQTRGNLTCFRCGKKGHKNTGCGVIIDRNANITRKEKDENLNGIKCISCDQYGHINCKFHPLEPEISYGDFVYRQGNMDPTNQKDEGPPELVSSNKRKEGDENLARMEEEI